MIFYSFHLRRISIVLTTVVTCTVDSVCSLQILPEESSTFTTKRTNHRVLPLFIHKELITRLCGKGSLSLSTSLGTYLFSLSFFLSRLYFLANKRGTKVLLTEKQTSRSDDVVGSLISFNTVIDFVLNF